MPNRCSRRRSVWLTRGLAVAERGGGGRDRPGVGDGPHHAQGLRVEVGGQRVVRGVGHAPSITRRYADAIEKLSLSNGSARAPWRNDHRTRSPDGRAPSSWVAAATSAPARWASPAPTRSPPCAPISRTGPRAVLAAPPSMPCIARTRDAYGRLVGVTPDRVAIGSHVSAMVSVLAAAVPDGAEVLCVDWRLQLDGVPLRGGRAPRRVRATRPRRGARRLHHGRHLSRRVLARAIGVGPGGGRRGNR